MNITLPEILERDYASFRAILRTLPSTYAKWLSILYEPWLAAYRRPEYNVRIVQVRPYEFRNFKIDNALPDDIGVLLDFAERKSLPL
ncbi:MAG: hypothetical protein P4M09_30290 [Devosia sp.]|nr:hypothetical protein [Devosia sp.]